MKSLTKRMLTFILLLIAWGTFIHAQSTGDLDQAKRIGLTLVDNQSAYTTVGEKNIYTNTLRLNQPSGSYKLTASMLNDGNNPISIHRIDSKNGDNEIASFNIQAVKTEPTSTILSILDFYQDGTNPPSTQTTITQAMLPENWGTNGSNLIWQTSGYAYVSGSGGFTYTVPNGYDNINLQFIIYVGSNARGGYFTYNLNNEGWTIASSASAGGTSSFVVGGVSSGDVISIYGGTYNNGYYLNASPDINLIGAISIPTSFIPTIEVTQSGRTTVYQPNDTVDLYGLGDIIDTFEESTAENNHPSKYTYKAQFDANVVLPSGSSTGEDFYASADFSSCTTSDPASATMTGYDGWAFNYSNAYSSSGIISMYIQYYGATIFTMPENFMGNSVNVAVTSSTGSDGAGILYVNDVPHTFTSGSTYTWTVPVTSVAPSNSSPMDKPTRSILAVS